MRAPSTLLIVLTLFAAPAAAQDVDPLAPDAPAAKPDAEKRALEERVKRLEERLSAMEKAPPPRKRPAATKGGGAVAVLKNLAKRVELHGDAVGSFVWNTNDPPGRKAKNLFRVSDLDHDTFAPTWASLTLSRQVEGTGLDWGFAVGLAAGRMVQGTLSLDPQFLGGRSLNLTEAYVELQLPTPLPVRVKVGRAFGWFGTESLHLGDSQMFTLSVLANFTPYTNTGVFVEVDLLKNLHYMQYVGNGSEVVLDNNDSKTVGGRLSYEPFDGLSLALHWIYGAERDNNEHDQRMQLELDAVFQATDSTALYLMLHYGHEEGQAVNGGGIAKFGGASLAVRQGFLPAKPEKKGEAPSLYHLVAMGRITVYRDQGGANSGVDQTLSEYSLGLEVDPLPFIWIRAEWRLDLSSQPNVFLGKRGQPTRRHQDTFGIAMGARF